MKKLFAYLSFLSIVFLVGCGVFNSEETISPVEPVKVPVAEEPIETVESIPDTPASSDNLELAFAEYLDAVGQFAAQEEYVIGVYSSVTGENYVDDETMYYALLDEVIPGYRQFTTNLETIMPTHPQVRELHEKYIEAANLQYGAFTLMLSALEAGDAQTMQEANAMLDEARRLLREWLYEVEDFSAQTGIEPFAF